MYPLVRSFHEEHFRELNNKHLDMGSRPKEVSTPGIGEEHMPRYKRMSNPVCGCPQSPRSVRSALLSVPRCRHTASRFRYLISLTVMTVSFGTSNTFPNLVKDLNKGESVPQVSPHWTVLRVSSGNILHSLEVSR